MSQRWYCPVCERIFSSSRTFLSHLKGRKNQECQFFYRENQSAEPLGPYNPNSEEREAPIAPIQPLPELHLPPARDSIRDSASQPISQDIDTFTPNVGNSPSFSLNEDVYDDFGHDGGDTTPVKPSVTPNEVNISPDAFAATLDDGNDNIPNYNHFYSQYSGNLNPPEEVLGKGESYAKTNTCESTMREKFIHYQAKAKRQNGCMQPEHKCGLELMGILDKEGVSLSLYNQLMDWHVENSYCKRCQRPTQERLSDKDLFEHLRERHGMEDLMPYPVRTYLPYAGMHVDVPCHDAAAVIRDLLTDPRICDNDYLFFNNDPTQGPPPEWDEVADINTGLAYRETYNRIIRDNPKTKCGRHKVLMPVIMYMDGVTTGQFQNLGLELLKVTLGVFTSEARDRGDLWRNLGAMPKVMQSKAKAHAMLGKASNSDAQNYLTHKQLRTVLHNNQPEEGGVSLNGGFGANVSPNVGNGGSVRLNEGGNSANGANNSNVMPNIGNSGNVLPNGSNNNGNVTPNDGNNTQFSQNSGGAAPNGPINGKSNKSKQAQSTRTAPPFECNDYIPELCDSPDEAQHGTMPKNKAQDFHCMMHTALASYKELQDKEGIDWDLFFESKLWYLRFIPFLIFFKGDGVEQEKQCAKYGVRNGRVCCLCRHCCCPTADTDDPYKIHALKNKPMMVKLVREKDFDGLRVMSQQYVWNAWYELRFGLHNNRSIHGASPMELLHWIQLGQYKYTRDMLFEQTGEGKMGKDLNDYCCALGPMFQRQSDKSFPRCHFTNTIMKGILMAHEMTGVILLILVAMRSTRGRQIMIDNAKYQKQKDYFRHISDWIMLLELQLELISWLKSPTMKVSDVEHFRVKCREYMCLYRLVGKRIKGMQFKTMNFHGMLHVAEDILNFGVPNNVDTKSDEHHHRDDKKATKRTQHRPDNFEIQSMERIVDRRAVQYGIAELKGAKRWDYYKGIQRINLRKRSPNEATISHDEANNSQNEATLGPNGSTNATFGQNKATLGSNEATGTSLGQNNTIQGLMRKYAAIKDSLGQNVPTNTQNEATNTQNEATNSQNQPDMGFSVGGVKANFTWCAESEEYVMSTKSRMKDKSQYRYEPTVKAIIESICFDCEEYMQTVSTYSEVRMDDGQRYRANPSYLGKPWYDWARCGHRLMHIKCFVDLTGLPKVNRTNYESRIYMIVEPAGVGTADENRYFPCEIVEIWAKLPDRDFPNVESMNNLRVFPVAEITGPACVIPDIDNPDHRAFLRVKPPSEWASLFLEFLRSPPLKPEGDRLVPLDHPSSPNAN